MNPIQQTKTVLLLRPQLKDDGDFANNTYLDTAGWGNVRFLLAVGDTDVASGEAIGSTAEATAPLVEECDTTGGSYTAVSGAALADAIDYDEDAKLFAIDVDLHKSGKRYMRIKAPHSAAGAVNGSNLCIIGILSQPDGNAPANAAQQGLEELIAA